LECGQFPKKFEKNQSVLEIVALNSAEKIFPKGLSICNDEKAKPPSKVKPETKKITKYPSKKEHTDQLNVVTSNPENEFSDTGKLILSNLSRKTSITNSNTLPVSDNVSLDLKDDLMNILDSVWF
jgi:hypothetical protein